MSHTKTATGTGQQRARLFPIARVSRVPLRVGLEYGMTISGVPMDAPTVAMPVRSSLAQKLNIHRYQLSRNIRLLHGYGFAPGNPVLKADSTPLQARVAQAVDQPQMTRFGQTPIPGQTPVFPRTGARGVMRAVRRFPKAIPVTPNNWTPPVYGGQEAPNG